MKLLLLLIAALLASCASLTDFQAECESRFQAFPDFAVCYKSLVTADRRSQTDPRVKLLLLRAEQLSQQVTQGNIADIDAKVEFQQTFLRLRQSALAEASDDAAASQTFVKQKVRTNCTTTGHSTSCISK
jgi:hypothetical protein